ncbi:irregular chiasm C-roughest protein-like [Oppia nitens]|uniref:irregular chiasm C-roughest protein-like n=1 Tax=Oppia nitens TaxID=1686743 RepID=UPI0023DC4E21|nr:irregular chiasm C-roughest protein-like [Oppia nitens]
MWCYIISDLIYAQIDQRFAIEPSDKTAIVGDTVILPCRVDHKQGTLQWTRDGFGLGTDRTLNGFPRYLMIGTDDEGDFSLQISSVSLEDDAVFQCQVGASDGIRGIRSRSATFTIFAPPEHPVIVQSRAQGDYLRTTAGITVELTCEAHGGKPPAELTWLDWEGNPVTSGISYTTQLLSDGKRWNAALKWTFIASKEFDGKQLTCRSENAALKQPKYTHIKVEVRYAPEVRIQAESVQQHIGEDVQLVCDAVGNPSQLTYKWFKNDEPVVGDHGSRLVIHKVGKDMNGMVISCEAANSVGVGRAKWTLDVIYGPYFRTPLDSSTGSQMGQQITLRCDVDSNPRPNITWLMAGSTQVMSTGPELMIRDMSADKVGRYMCRASVKGFAEISAQSLVFIKGPPRIRRPYVQYGTEGQSVTVECIIDSIPSPSKILWFHNSRLVDVDNNDGYELIEDTIQSDSTFRSMISIRKSKIEDFGQYNCSVWNDNGFDSKLIILVYLTNFSPLVLSIGVIISGIVFIIASTIIIILCLKRKNKFTDNDSYGNDLKKGQVLTVGNSTALNGKHMNHSVMDSGSSGADSDIKVEVRTASSLSQHWDENEQQFSEDIAKQTTNGYYSSCVNNNCLFVSSNHVSTVSPTQTPHASIIISSVDNQRASYAIEPTYGTLVADQRYRSVGYANPYLRTSNSSSIVTTSSSDNNNSNNQLSAGMYSASQRYITNNGQLVNNHKFKSVIV